MTSAPGKKATLSSDAQAGPVRRYGIQVGRAVLQILPGSIRRRLETEPGKRFARFVPVAIAALISSQITLAVLYNEFHVTAGKSALCASMIGAAVSYVLSRWAWERKGRPDLLRETVPFWLVSLTAWTILSLTSHFASSWAKSEGLSGLERALVVNGAYLFANCFTFISRFLIFHYVLFRDKGRKRAGGAGLAVAQESDLDGAEPVPVLTGDSTSRPKMRS